MFRIKSNLNVQTEKDVTIDELNSLKALVKQLRTEGNYYKNSAIKSEGLLLKKDRYIEELLREINNYNNNNSNNGTNTNITTVSGGNGTNTGSIINNTIHIGNLSSSPMKYKEVIF
jgi:hypothetical protein